MNIEIVEFLNNTVKQQHISHFLKFLNRYMSLFAISEVELEDLSDIYLDEYLRDVQND
jgi:hypothetical protein